jgi:hypothetical protein
VIGVSAFFVGAGFNPLDGIAAEISHGGLKPAPTQANTSRLHAGKSGKKTRAKILRQHLDAVH